MRKNLEGICTQRDGKYKSLRDMIEYKIQHTHNESFRKEREKWMQKTVQRYND